MTDRVVQYPNRYQLVPVVGTSDTFDLVTVPGVVTEAGDDINKANLLPDTLVTALGLNPADNPQLKDAIAAVVTFGSGTIAASASWSGPNAQGYYTYAVTATGVLSTDKVKITRVKDVSDSAAARLIQIAWNTICQAEGDVVISANTLTFYSKTRPAVAVPILWEVAR